MKKSYTFPDISRLSKYLIALVCAILVSFTPQLLTAQCDDFIAIVDTDPPYLTYCPGDTIIAFPIIEGGTGPFTYMWSTGGTDSIEVVVALEDGWYQACVTVTDANGCEAYSCKHIKPTYYNIYINNSGPQCLGESIQLEVSVYAPNTFLWSTGETSNPIYVTEPGIYSVTVTDPVYGCVKVMYATADFFPMATPEITGGAAVCDGQSTTLEVVDAGLYYNFVWLPNGESTSSIEVTESGTYSVTATDWNGCTGTAEFVVDHLFGTIPELTAPPQLCPEVEGTIEVTNAGDLVSFIWNTGATTSSISGTAPETYSVTVTDINGCMESAEISIDAFEVVDPVLLGDADICFEQESVIMSVDQSFVQYQWSTGEATQSITVTDPGAYQVTVTDVNGCTTTGEHQIIAAPIPEPFIQAPPLSCDSLPVLLQVGGNGGPYLSYLWMPTGEYTAEIIVGASGTFTVQVWNVYGCTGTSFEEIVEIGSGPDAEILVTPINCNESVILTASGEGTYYWSTGEYEETITVVASGTYSLTVTADDGCTDTAEVNVSISGTLEVEVIGPSVLCEGENVTLSLNAIFDNYLWSTGETTSEIDVTQSGTYSITVSDDTGCTGISSLTISAAPLPDPQINGLGALCGGDTVTLQLNEQFVTMLWSNGATTQSITVTEPNQYSVTVTNAFGCTGMDEQTVTTIPPASVDIIGPASICTGGSTTLAVQGNYTSIAWNTGEMSPEIVINSSGTFSVAVTDSNGCTAADVHQVAAGDSLSPVITVTSPPCADTIMLDAGSGYSNYLWSNDSTTSNILVMASGTYSVTVSDGSGCSGQSTTNVSVGQPPQISISGPANACAGESSTLIASPGFASYLWSNGATTDSVNISQPGVYSVMATTSNGCTATAEISFEVFPVPNVEIFGPATICTGSSATLMVSGTFSTITWSTSETTPSILVSGSGTYHVTVTDSNGCTATAVQLVATADSLSPVIIATASCDGQVTLDAGIGYDAYLWSNGLTTSDIIVSTAGIYTVTVSDMSGCSGQDVINVTIPVPPQISITGPSSECAGSSALLAASPGFVSYAWSTGDTTDQILISSTGDYSVVATDTNGCTAEASHAFEELPQPVIEITGPEFMCGGETTTLIVSGIFSQITWSTGAIVNSIDVVQGGSYSVVVTDANGCTATDELTVTQLQTDYTFTQIETCSVQDTGTVESVMTNQFGCDSIVTISSVLVPSLTTTISLSACAGESVIFNGVEIAAGSNQQFVFTASSGCDSLVTVSVAELPPVDFDLQATATCPNAADGQIEVSVNQNTSTFLFTVNGNQPQVNPVFSGLSAGVYSVLVVDSNGCADEKAIEVLETVAVEVVVVDQQISCGAQTIVLEPIVMAGDPAGIEWLWSNGSTLSSIEVSSPGLYSVSVYDGCSEQELTIHVDVSSELQEEDFFFVPNVFSPNGDDANERLRVFPDPDLIIHHFDFRIFDRWGNLMFGTMVIDDSWDGAFKSVQMEPGVYVWFITADVDVCGKNHHQILSKGDVTIIR